MDGGCDGWGNVVRIIICVVERQKDLSWCFFYFTSCGEDMEYSTQALLAQELAGWLVSCVTFDTFTDIGCDGGGGRHWGL